MILNLDTCIRVLHAAVLFVATLHHFFIRTMSSATSARGKLNNFLMNLIKINLIIFIKNLEKF